MPSIEEAWWPAAHGDRQVAGEPPWIREALSDEECIAAARALALAVLEDMDEVMREEARRANDGFWLKFWSEAEIRLRARIEALG